MKRIIISFLAFTLLALMFAAVPAQAKSPDISYISASKCTQIRGELGGADYEILMPDNWNGMLVVECRGYSHGIYPIEPSNMHTMGLGFVAASSTNPNFAVAWSNFGESGWCVDIGVIRTHQLTEYVIDNYGVTGEVFLVGTSMGGEVACLLGAKYPDLYSGVLDVCGVKELSCIWSLPQLSATMKDDIVIQCRGTPDIKPQMYEKLSPTYQADITIPVISILGSADPTVPIQQFDMYYDTVAQAGCLANYRSYTITTSVHCGIAIQAKIPQYFLSLYNWVMTGTGPGDTLPPIP